MPTAERGAINHLVREVMAFTFEKEVGHPPVLDAVRSLTAVQAAWKPHPDRHSIWQIVRHLALWKQYTLEEWDGGQPDPKRYMGRDWGAPSGGEQAWDADLRQLTETFQALLGRAASLSDADLLEPMPRRPDQSRALALLDLATHDAYHAGQIRHLRALQGV